VRTCGRSRGRGSWRERRRGSINYRAFANAIGNRRTRRRKRRFLNRSRNFKGRKRNSKRTKRKIRNRSRYNNNNNNKYRRLRLSNLSLLKRARMMLDLLMVIKKENGMTNIFWKKSTLKDIQSNLVLIRSKKSSQRSKRNLFRMLPCYQQ